MKTTSFIYVGVIAAMGALSLGTGCDDGGTGGSGGSGGGHGGSTSSSSGSSSSGTAATCDAYCATIAANCKDATTKQYTDDATCKAVCAAYTPGTVGAMSGNSLECRNYHAGAAATDAATHCPHAGPSGGDKDPTDTNGAACGEACDSFCDIAVKVCSAQYADKSACMADCKTFKASATSYDLNDTSKDDFNCRLYHLNAAATNAAVHCPHIVGASPVCTM